MRMDSLFALEKQWKWILKAKLNEEKAIAFGRISAHKPSQKDGFCILDLKEIKTSLVS